MRILGNDSKGLITSQSYHPHSWLSCRLFCWLFCRLFRGMFRGFPSRPLGRTARWIQSSNRKRSKTKYKVVVRFNV